MTSRKRTTAPSDGGKVLRPVVPNAGIKAAYRKRLMALIDDMQASVVYWLRAKYKENAPLIAQDSIPANELQYEMDRLGTQWLNKFDDGAQKLAEWFAQKTKNYTDGSLKAILQEAGIAVQWRMTDTMRDAYQAVIHENVGLIRSIPRDYLMEVQGLVMRSVQVGRDASYLTDELTKRYGITQRRAELISRDQNNKATSVMNRTRQLEIGITQAKWRHSHAGQHPRISHLEADGKVYNIAEGCKIDGEFIWPGEKINCFPGDMIVGLENGVGRVWRTLFNGPMVHIEIGSDLLKGTLNHPILTINGWVRLGDVQNGDKILCMSDHGGDIVNHDIYKEKTTFVELFESRQAISVNIGLPGRGFDFHGHIPDCDVDEVIVVDYLLTTNVESGSFQDRGQLEFSKPDGCGYVSSVGIGHQFVSAHKPCGDRGGALLFCTLPTASEQVGVGPGSDRDIICSQYPVDGDCACPGKSEVSSDGCGTQSGFVKGNDIGSHGYPVISSVGHYPDRSEFFAQLVRIAADEGRTFFKVGTRSYEVRSARNKSIRDFSGHVYTMETEKGYYSVSGAHVQAKNCRCTAKPILPGWPQ